MEELLQKLIEMPTTTDNKQANADLINYIGNFLSERGMHVTHMSSNGYAFLVATTRPGAKHSKIMLSAHTDVTAAPPALFKLQKYDGKYFGRGVFDMKFAIVNFLQLVDDIKGNIADYDFSIAITSDEEIGGENGMLKILEAGYRADICILPDGGGNWEMERVAKGVDWYQIDTTGRTAHASTPWLGESATENLFHLLHDIKALFPNQNPENNTINIGTIHSGTTTNQLAESATATIDVRTISPEDQKRLRQQIADLCAQHSATGKRLFENGDVVITDQNNPFVVRFKQIVEAVTGAIPGTKVAHGSSDARYLAAYDTLCMVISPCGGGHHSDNEWLEVKGFNQYKEILRRYLDEVAR
ncbi:MAG TPA: M20/M25/M40 family metallo-hydrolase [Patescibacteria group bacterium]|nr:M20/M25/M40 family metallo-hydrolase [Patescibacteria group bacterium]